MEIVAHFILLEMYGVRFLSCIIQSKKFAKNYSYVQSCLHFEIQDPDIAPPYPLGRVGQLSLVTLLCACAMCLQTIILNSQNSPYSVQNSIVFRIALLGISLQSSPTPLALMSSDECELKSDWACGHSKELPHLNSTTGDER